jgi:hypothetical protein
MCGSIRTILLYIEFKRIDVSQGIAFDLFIYNNLVSNSVKMKNTFSQTHLKILFHLQAITRLSIF